MPCNETCDTRLLLFAKESRLSKSNQTKEWIEELGQLEPHQGDEIRVKLSIVDDKILQSVTDAGLLVNQIARGCNQCQE